MAASTGGSRSLPGGVSGRWNWRQWKRRRFIGSWPDSFPAEAGSSFGHLHDMQMEMLACLRGIGRLSGSGGRKTAQIAVPEEPAAKALEKRYHCARRAVTEYTVRTVDGDFGIVFQHLADLSREECVLLARLLGEQAQNISRS